MRRTNKRHKKQNNIKKRKTLKKRFSKKGGNENQTYCNVCKKWFFNVGKPVTSLDKNSEKLYENHIKTHPKCMICNEKPQFLDINGQDRSREYDKPEYPSLISHLETTHPEKYKLAESIKYGINNESNLIDKLRNNVWSEIGNPPELKEFYTKIEDKQKSIEKKEADKRVKEEQDRLKAEKAAKKAAENAAKKTAKVITPVVTPIQNLAKEAERERQAAIRAEREAQKKAEAEAKKLAEEAEKEKADKERLAEIKAKKALKRAAKEAAIAEKELTAMGAEDINIIVPEVNQKLIEELNTANTVEDTIEIIESATEPTVSKVNTASVQNINLISMLSNNEFRIINSGNFQGDITYGMPELFPVTNCFSEEINSLTNKETNFNEYKFVNNLILFLVGLFNYKFIKNKIDIKMIIKGGKGAQIILSNYSFFQFNEKGEVNCNIISDDIDILLVQKNGYNRETLYSVAFQFSELVKKFIDGDDKYIENELIIIKRPIPIDFNPNIFKISYINKTEPTKIIYNVVSDIDIKQVETEYFNTHNLEPINLPFYYGKNKYFNLTYWLQTPQAFLAEKQHYLSIYENIIQKSSRIKDKICDCNNIIEKDNPEFDNDCYMTCKVREMMIPKFQKYITPFQQLVNMLNSQTNSNFAGHYSL